MVRLVLLAALALAASLQLIGGTAAQQTFPARTVHFILPFGPASASDMTARLFADRSSARWGKPVVVDNRPGGDGLVSLDAFVAAHDDHTMWFGPAGTFNVLPYQHDTLPFDPKRDLNPIASVSEVVLAISMPVSMNVTSIDQLVALARAQPGKLNAAAANGISDFLLFGFIKSMGLEIVRVPYRDIMQAPNDLAESSHPGSVDVACGGAAVEQGSPHQGAGGDQPPARPERARRPDRSRSRISGADIRKHRRGVRNARHAGQIARAHCGGFPGDRQGSDHRPAASRYRANHVSPWACRIRRPRARAARQARRNRPDAWPQSSAIALRWCRPSSSAHADDPATRSRAISKYWRRIHVSSGRRGWCVCPGCGAARRAARAASRLAPIEVARRGAPLIRDLRKLRPWRGGRASAVASKVPDLQCMMAAAHARLSNSRCCSTLRPCCNASGIQAPQPVTLQTTGQEQGRPANNRRGTGAL